MGIITSFAALLVRAKADGVPFDASATIGRQTLAVPLDDLAAFARRLAIAEPDWNTFAADGYAEDFFASFLGAERVTSFDASSYQGASVVHDFNTPLPPDYAGVFDAIVDGGTMEHIFDIKQLLTNYMQLVKVGGSVFVHTNANNLCGHGFYQFSPEFFYRVFTEANGFCVEQLCLIETPFIFLEKSGTQRVYEAADPSSVGKRAVIVTDKPVSVFVHARRIAERRPFATPPCQSDYAATWDRFAPAQPGEGGEEAEQAPVAARAAGTRYSFAYVSAWEALRRALRQKRKNSLHNSRWFKVMSP